MLLLLSRSEYIGTEARTPANHLLKLDFRFHNLEENQVKHLGHIDTRIEHIHRNCYLGILFRSFEFTYQPVMMFHLIIDKLTVVCSPLRIKRMKPLYDAFGMQMIVGKENGLADVFPAVNLQSVGHQFSQHMIDGIIVDEIAEQLVPLNVAVIFFGRRNALLHLFIRPYLFQLLLLFGSQLIITDAPVHEFRGAVFTL